MSPEDSALRQLVLSLRDVGYQFTTVTPLTHSRVNKRQSNGFATDLSGVFGWSRPFRQGLLPASLVELMRTANVLAHGQDGDARSLVRVSTIGDQLFLHSAFPTNEANAVFFGPDTMRFVRVIREHLKASSDPPTRVADIGCGAGPGGIAIAATVPTADVLMLDINAVALRYARVNADINGVRARAQHSNILADVSGTFDLIVANPPYLIDEKERAYRHGGGQFGEGLSLQILQQALPRLTKGGTLLLYTGTAIISGVDRFRTACSDLLRNAHMRWSYTEVDPDVFGEELDMPAYSTADRIAAVVLTVTSEVPCTSP